MAAYLGYKRCVEIEFEPPESWTEVDNGDGTYSMTASQAGANIKIIKQGGDPQAHMNVTIGSYVDRIGSAFQKIRVF